MIRLQQSTASFTGQRTGERGGVQHVVGKATSAEQVAIKRIHPWEEIEIVDAIDIVQSAQVITAHIEWR